MRSSYRLAGMAIAASAILVGAGCGDDGDDQVADGPTTSSGIAVSPLATEVPSPFPAPTSQADQTFVTANTDIDPWLAVVIRDGDALGYVCDGVDVYRTVTGAVDEDGPIQLKGSGTSFVGNVTADAITGTLAVGELKHDVTLATAVVGTTGLYRLVDGDAVTWWIQTPAGLKGATTLTNGRRGRAFATSDASGFNSNTAAGAGEAP
jgi:hypothetical protein